jgi:predicted DNA-binding ribbon-helix-helix protein
MLEMKSPVVKRSIVVAGHKTSVSLEAAFWKGLKDIAAGRRMSLSDLVGAIHTERRHGNLSSAIRLFVLEHYQTLSDLSREAEDRHELPLAPAERPEGSTMDSPGINGARIN